MKTPQTTKILQYLKEHREGITPIDALHLFGCFRLSARIADLRDKGYAIEAVRETKGGKTYCRYTLAD